MVSKSARVFLGTGIIVLVVCALPALSWEDKKKAGSPTPPKNEDPHPIMEPPPPPGPPPPLTRPSEPLPPGQSRPWVPPGVPHLGQPLDDAEGLSVEQLDLKALTYRRLALWKAFRLACPSGLPNVCVYAENAALTEICFLSEEKLMFFSRKSGKVRELIFQKPVHAANSITFEKGKYGELGEFAAWYNGKLQIQFPEGIID